MQDMFLNKILEKRCLDKGFVKLVDCMPRLAVDSLDSAIVQAARVSYGIGTKTPSEDIGLIRYLMRNRHTTPIEMVEFKFHCKVPIFVARQWLRHRMASVNEYSARYSIVPDEYYIPQSLRIPDSNNKQGSIVASDSGISTQLLDKITKTSQDSYALYEELLASGVAREHARIVLPTNFYTEFYWKIDLHNLLHFLSLRSDSHAQFEIRVYSDALIDIISQFVPITVQAWNDYHPLRNGMSLSRTEVWALYKDDDDIIENKREKQEFLSKKVRLKNEESL